MNDNLFYIFSTDIKYFQIIIIFSNLFVETTPKAFVNACHKWVVVGRSM